MNRYAIVLAIALIALAVFALTPWQLQAPPTQERPNILLILVDDMGAGDTGVTVLGTALTPNIDRLAAEGVQFDRHYADATCRPARAALLTGMNARRVGVPTNMRGISPEVQTLPELLREAGYKTIHIGKWHLGEFLPSAAPDRQGFDSWFGFLSALETRHGAISKPASTYKSPFLRTGPDAPVQFEGHMTDLFTAKAVDTITDMSSMSEPWFINLWFFAPHHPLQPADRFAERFPDSEEGRYLALLAQLDESIGAVIEALEQTGQRSNTLVVLASDNGATARHRDSNRPFAGKKEQYLEGGLRTPFILNHPSLPPMRISDPVFISDIAPTLLGYAGISPAESMQGRNLGPLLRGDNVEDVRGYFWDVQTPYYVRWGMMNLAEGRMVYMGEGGALVQHWLEGQQRFSPPVSPDSAELESAKRAYQQWRNATRQVPLIVDNQSESYRAYTGDSYRRTPGYGMWSMQIPLSVSNAEPLRIYQAGHFELRVASGLIEAEMPGREFSFTTDRTGCHLITLSAVYDWRLRKPDKSRAILRVYLGDEQVHEERFSISADLHLDDYPPTYVDHDAGELRIYNDFIATRQLSRYSGSVDCPAAVN